MNDSTTEVFMQKLTGRLHENIKEMQGINSDMGQRLDLFLGTGKDLEKTANTANAISETCGIEMMLFAMDRLSSEIQIMKSNVNKIKTIF
jgi:hypothetical protein